MSMPARNIRRSLEAPCLALGLILFSAAAGDAQPCGVVVNQGQIPGGIAYYARCGNAILYFTETDVVLDFPELQQSVRMRFNSPSGPATLEPRHELDLRLSFFYGRDPAGWRSGVPVYESLIYRNLWPGVDLIVRPVDEGLRYAFSKALPFAGEESPFVFDGIQRMTREPDGSLRLEMAGVALADRLVSPGGAREDGSERILSWGGPSSMGRGSVMDRGTVEGTLETTARSGTIAFDLGTFLGAGDLDRAHGVNLDAQGRPIVIGYTRSSNFPLGPGGWDTSHNGGYDVFILKMDPAGSRILWGTFIGGSGEDRPMDVKLDSVGNLLVAGTTTSSNFPTTAGAWDRTLGGDRDGFVAKFDPECTRLLWSTYLGGTATGDDEFVWNIEMTQADEPVIGGRTNSNDFPTTPGAYDSSYGGGYLDGYVTRLSANGSALIWSTFIGGISTDEVFDFVLDDEERPILAVITSSPGMYTSPDAYDASFSGMRDFMITILSSDGRTVGYSTYFGGPGDEGEARIARDSQGRILLAGFTGSATDIAVGDVYDATYNGGRDAFVARFDAWGTSAPLWCTYLGGNGNDVGEDIFFDARGKPVLCGYAAPGFPVTLDAFQAMYRGGDSDAFMARLDSDGTGLLYSTYVGGSDHEELWDMAQDATGHVYVSGHTGSSDFPTTAGAFDRTFNSPPGGRDAVLVRFAVDDSMDPAGVDPYRARMDLRSRATPNPSAGPVRIECYIPVAGAVTVQILQASGAVVRRIESGRRPAGVNEISWDGRDEAGRIVASGVYLTRVAAKGATGVGKIVWVR